jgi:beta-lactamase class C
MPIILFTLTAGYANCDTIEHQSTQLMQKNKINGMAIAIINQGDAQFCNYGYTSTNHKNKINEHTLFEIASISKTFTATLAGIATAQGVFDLQKPISDYVSDLKTNPIYQKVNSQELLAFVSGLSFTQESNFEGSQIDFLNALLKVNAQYPPQTYPYTLYICQA